MKKILKHQKQKDIKVMLQNWVGQHAEAARILICQAFSVGSGSVQEK